MKFIRKPLADGVSLTYLPARKFKTGLLSAQFVAPLSADTASAYALLPSVLRRGTVSCPDMASLSARLDNLYGARIDDTVRKIGECQCVGFTASFLDDRFVPGGERLLESVTALLGELLRSPVTENGAFVPAYFDSEKTNLLDAIGSIRNDKRLWAGRRLLSEMCAGEPYGVSRLGEEADADALNNADAYRRYQETLRALPLEIVYCGSAEESEIENAVRAALDALPREDVRTLPAVLPHVPRADVLRVSDAMDVTQGKLELGFSCGSDDYMALLMGNTLFGGSSNAKLFMNVREKLSLCYYASSAFHRQKNLVTVSSGIEFGNYQRAFDEIMEQLRMVQNGEFEDWEIDSARSLLLNSYASMGDAQGKLENFYLSRAVTGFPETPETLSENIRDMTLERVIEAMRTVKLDTVYFLKGKEAAE
ncbi:MAG: insulinase family protein [Oscillibacter sp.]|nr:insulinase family protein [Oscillibacter sp.]